MRRSSFASFSTTTHTYRHLYTYTRAAIDTGRMFEATMAANSSSAALLPEETHVRVGENALVASLTFALFWATFGLAWLASNRYVPEFRVFPAPQKADWCSRCVSSSSRNGFVQGIFQTDFVICYLFYTE